MNFKITSKLLFLCLVGCFNLFGQFTQPYLRKISKNEGLTGALVLTIVQDSRNLYWIGTLNGIQQFDGKTFKKIPLPIYQNGIYGSNSVSNLLIGNDSCMWVANYQGIAKFNLYSHAFELISVPKEHPAQTISFTSLFKDSESNIWATSFEMGLIKYNPQLNKFERVQNHLLNTFKRVKAQESTIAGNLLLFHKKGVDFFDKSSNAIKSKEALPLDYFWMKDRCFDGEIYDVLDAPNNVFALIWNTKKVQYDFIQYNKLQKTCNVLNFSSIAGRRFFMDSNKNVWIYGDGIDVIPAGSNEIIPIKENIKEGRQVDFTMCHRMYEDNEHNVWFCTNSGLFVFNINEKNFSICNEKTENGYIKHVYNCMHELSNKEIWVGTFGEGLIVLDEKLKQQKQVDFEKITKDKHFNLLWQIYETQDKSEVWIGCQKGRLIRYDKRAQEYSYFTDSCFGGKTVMCIAEDEFGTIYFGTNGGAIIKKVKNSDIFQVLYQSDLLEARTAAGEIKSMVYLNGRLIVATLYDGIVSIHPKTNSVEKFNMDIANPKALKSNNVFCLLPNQNNYFVGTSNGLGYFDEKQKGFDFYTMYDGLPFSNLYDLISIGNNTMIASTSDGLYKINWDLKSFERVEKNANLYKGFNFIYKLKNENNLLLADDEYLYLLPIVNNDKKKLPLSHLYAIRSFDKAYHIQENNSGVFKFDQKHTTINIDFGASTFKYYNSIDYYYMLDGVDKDWIFAGNNRTVTYNNLKGDSYRFRLKCVFQEDKNQSEELVLDFSIEKPFYQSVWFYLLVAFIIVALFYVFYRIRLNKLLAIEKIRFDLSKDLHDDMGSTLSTINILSVIAENKIDQNKSMSQEYLKRISLISQGMMESMDDIVWSINPNNDNIGKVVVRMREFAAQLLEPLDINMHFEVNKNVSALEVKMKWRRDFYLIFKEAVNNIAKYSKCKNVYIEINSSNRMLQLNIKDDGIGFDAELESNGNGLINMKNRAGEVGAIITIASKPGAGTTIQLQVPLNRI